MKRTIRITTALLGAMMALTTATSASADMHGAGHGKNIVQVATEAGDFQTLLTALDAAALTETLSGAGPFTVFAPTDAAFAALPEGALADLLANPDRLAEVLTLHVVSGRALAADVVKLSEVATVQGQSLAVKTHDGVTVGGAKVVATDVEANNGVIHVIDRVILPKS